MEKYVVGGFDMAIDGRIPVVGGEEVLTGTLIEGNVREMEV